MKKLLKATKLLERPRFKASQVKRVLGHKFEKWNTARPVAIKSSPQLLNIMAPAWGLSWRRAQKLKQVNLRGANLTRANLTRADLTGADLSGIDLTGANLTHATIQPRQLAKVYRCSAEIINGEVTLWITIIRRIYELFPEEVICKQKRTPANWRLKRPLQAGKNKEIIQKITILLESY